MVKRKIIYPAIISVICVLGGLGPLRAEEVKMPLKSKSAPEPEKREIFDKRFLGSGIDFEAEKKANKTEQSSNSANFAYGRFQSSLYDIFQSSRTDSFYYTLLINVEDSNGERPNSFYTRTQPAFKVGVLLDEENELIFKTSYFEKTMGLPGAFSARTLGSERKNYNFRLSSQFMHTSLDKQIVFEPYHEGSALNDNLQREDFRNTISGAKVGMDIDGNTLNINLYERQLEHYYRQTILDSQFKLRPLDLSDRWQMSSGGSIFCQEEFGQRLAPFLEVIFHVNEQCSHKLRFNRDFEPVVFNRTYLEENYLEVNPQAVRPKRRLNTAYHFDNYISPEWRMSVIAYFMQERDYWFLEDLDADGLYAPSYVKQVNFTGFKFATEYSWTESFSNFFSLNVRAVKSKDDNYEFIPFIPKQEVSLGFSYKIDKVKFDIVGDYFGRRYQEVNSKETFNAYFLMHSKLNYEVKDYLTIFILVDNLLNDHYEIVKGYPNQSRNTMAGIKLKF
ncbi:MAG: TonB-dependent receptor [Candidatus Omnitrophota bacterium]